MNSIRLFHLFLVLAVALFQAPRLTAQNDRSIALNNIPAIIQNMGETKPVRHLVQHTYSAQYFQEYDAVQDHVQGLARLSDGRYVYSHSGLTSNGYGLLAFTRPNETAAFKKVGYKQSHPSAIQACGNIVAVPAGEDKLDDIKVSIHFYDATNPDDPIELTHLKLSGLDDRYDAVGLVYNEAKQCHYLTVSTGREHGLPGGGLSLYKSNGLPLTDEDCHFDYQQSFNTFTSASGYNLLYDVSGDMYGVALYRTDEIVDAEERLRLTRFEWDAGAGNFTLTENVADILLSLTDYNTASTPGFRWGGTIVPTSRNSVEIIGSARLLCAGPAAPYNVIKIWSGRNQLEDCRKYSEVCWLTSHNATVSPHYGYTAASFGQAEDLDTQLDGGVRAFTFDCWSQTSLNAPNASAAYYELRDQQMIPDMVYAFSNPRRSGGEGDDLPGIAWPNGGVYYSRFDQWMSQIGTFLNRNPSEVVTIFLEGNANQSEFDSSFYSQYIDPTVVKHIMNQDDHDNLHNLTLEEIRSRGRRLAIFHRGGTMNFNVDGHQFQFRSQYEKMVENKPTVLPTGINSCEKRDGSDDLNTSGRLKVYNHFGQAYHELINRRWYEHCTDMGVPNFLVVNNATERSNGVLPRDAVKEFNRLFAEKIVGGPRTYNILEDNSQTTNIASEGGDGSHLLMGENLRNWEFTSGTNRTYRLRYHGTSSYLVAPIIGLNRCFIDSGYDPTERDNFIVEPLPDGKVRLVCEHNYGGGLQRALRVDSERYIRLSDNRDFGDVSGQKLELRPVLSLGVSCLAQPQYVVVLLDQNYQGFLQPEAVKEQINYNGVCESDILLSLNQEVFSCEDIGWRTVTLTASDGAGLSSSCTASILVAEHNPPSITCPNTKILAANENCENTLGSHQPISLTDDCTADGEITLFVHPGPGTVLSGHNDTVTVTMNAYDVTGNGATCKFYVILKDQTAPSLVCKNHTAYLNAQGTLSLTPNDIYQSGTDNCGAVNLTAVLPNTLNCSNIGPNTVVLEGSDGNGNYSTCLATVTVVDNIAPTVARQVL